MPVNLCQGLYVQLSGRKTQQLFFEDELALLVLLRALIRLVVLPSHGLFALPAADIPYHMSTGRHIALSWFACRDIDYVFEQVSFTVLPAEILC